MVGEGMLVGDALLRVHGRELRSAAGSYSVLIWFSAVFSPSVQGSVAVR